MQHIELTSDQRKRLGDKLRNVENLPCLNINFLNFREYEHRLGTQWMRCKRILFDTIEEAVKPFSHCEDLSLTLSDGIMIIFTNRNSMINDQILQQIKTVLSSQLKTYTELKNLKYKISVSQLNSESFKNLLHTTRHLSNDIKAATSRSGMQNAGPAVLFRPIWHPQKEIILGTFCYHNTYEQKKVRLDDLDYYTSGVEQFKHDALAVQAAIKAAVTIAKQGKRLKIFLPINFQNLLVDEMQKVYLHELKQIPSSLTKIIVPQLVRVGFSTSQQQQSVIIQTIKEIFPFVGVEANIAADTRILAMNELFAPISISVSSTQLEEGVSDPKQRYVEFAALCRKYNTNSIVHRINKPDTLLNTFQAEIAMMSGDLIWNSQDNIDFPVTLTKSELLKRLKSKLEQQQN